MKRWIMAFGALVAAASGGCAPIVLDPVDLGPQPVEPEPDVPNALAIRVGDWVFAPTSDDPDEPFGALQNMYQYEPDPDKIVLFFSDSVQQCSQPVIAPPFQQEPCESSDLSWQLIVTIPTSLNRPGLIDLRDPRVRVYKMVWKPPCGAVLAASFEEPDQKSTLEIVSSDESAVAVKLSMGSSKHGFPDIDGDYVAARCGTPPPESPPIPAVAMLGADLPAPLKGDPALDPEALYLFFGTEDETCKDPLASTDCTADQRVVLPLPPSLQKPGIIDLADPALAASLQLGFPENCNSDNGVLHASFAKGTLEILSIDGSGVSFRVQGSYVTLGVFDFGFCADGLYAATTCG